MSHTFAYKTGYIHITISCPVNSLSSYDKNYHIVQVQLNKYAYLIEVKSVHAAKLFITKHGDGYDCKV